MTSCAIPAFFLYVKDENSFKFLNIILMFNIHIVHKYELVIQVLLYRKLLLNFVMSSPKKEAVLGIFHCRAGGNEQYSEFMFHSSST